MKKLYLLLGSLFVATSLSAANLPADIKPTDLRTYGDKKNPTTIYVFSSLTCPHCATFHKNVMPKIKEKYVDTNKAQLVYVDMPYDPMAMTGFTISRCMPADKYESFMNLMFENQMLWYNSEKPREIMTRFATMLGGVAKEDVDKCLNNTELKKKIIEQRTNLAELYGVTGMPTVVYAKGTQSQKIEGADEMAILSLLDERMK